MTLTITPQEFQNLRDLIEEECGISVGEDKLYLIEGRLAKLVLENGCANFGEFYLKVKHSPDAKLKNKIIDAITTNETLWFRDETPFKVLSETLFPEYLEKLHAGEQQVLRIWSSACSSGQEPYSIAMLLDQFSQRDPRNRILRDKSSILATDISSSVIMLAKLARYDRIAMSRGMKPEYQEIYFEPHNSVYVLKDEIKSMVTFQQFNLQQSFQPLGKFDVIFLRNVAIYFSREFKRQLFRKIAQALTPGGYLFLGASENLLNYSDEFVLKEYDNGMYYQRND